MCPRRCAGKCAGKSAGKCAGKCASSGDRKSAGKSTSECAGFLLADVLVNVVVLYINVPSVVLVNLYADALLVNALRYPNVLLYVRG